MNRQTLPIFALAFGLLIAIAPAAADVNNPIPPPSWRSHLFASARWEATEPPVPDAPEPEQPAPPKSARPCTDPTVRASSGRCFVPLVGHDIAEVFTAPKSWRAKQWGIFSAGVVGVGVVMIFDRQINT